MNQQNMRKLTLFDLLARSWELPSAVESLQFSVDGAVAAFSCADGTIALARLADAEPPETRIRMSSDLGQTTIRPREGQPAPLIVAGKLSENAPLLAAVGESDFIAGTSSGRTFRVSSGGDVESAEIAAGGAVVALDHTQGGGVTALTDGNDVFLSAAPDDIQKIQRRGIGNIVALAFSPSGKHLAICSAEEVSIWAIAGRASFVRSVDLPGQPLSPSWSADDAWLACPLARGGFGLIDVGSGKAGKIADFPARVRTVSWSGPANALVASGAFRIASWSMTEPPIDDKTEGALVTGRPGLLIVETVAAHPGKPLVAAGYANGQITVAEIGGRDELLVKPSGGPVTTLAWSADGRHLAAGTADGKASLITFPVQLFK